MTTVQDPTVQRRRLRLELRKARDTAQLKQADVARAMDWSPSKLIRIERGDVGISTNDLKALLNHYGVKDKKRVDELLELARSSRGPSFYDQYVDLLKPGFKEYLAYESSASVVRQYDPIRIPGLLQTEEYARGLFAGLGTNAPETADRGWAIRRYRQEVVHERDNPPDMLFVLDEAALRRHIGGPDVMHHQLERLRDLAAEPYITMQVLPFTHGAHPGMSGNFILLEFADPDLNDLVHLESIETITIREDTDRIARYIDEFKKLQDLALSTGGSVNFITTLINEMSSPAQSTNSTPKEVS
ncbi:MAG: helix-turn-helix domain-containing protein [Pseudonocardiaceae bacterium]